MKKLFVIGLTMLVVQTQLSAQQIGSIRVVVWDEQQPAQKQAYDNFLGNAIADYLQRQPGLSVKSVRLDDPEQGLSKTTLDACDVLIWWGHVRQHEISTNTAQSIVQRIKVGQLSLIALHSAHWSTVFMEAMNERTRMDAQKRYGSAPETKVIFEFVPPTGRLAPTRDSIVTPAYYAVKHGGGVKVRVDLPNCCFPDYRTDGRPSQMSVLKPDHPIAAGLPSQFTIPQTEMYNEPFHVPEPSEVIFKESWATGEWFRSGLVWQLGGGKVFYFRPGHETFPVFKQELTLKVIANAVYWLGKVERNL